jgi:FkbM family methyltransferase
VPGKTLGLARFLNKPEYLWRPRQICRSMWRRISPVQPGLQRFDLSWGSSIYCNPGEVIGYAIASYGVYDLAVSETIYRLLDEGECAVDVGANIGHMSGVMAKRAGPRGCVVAFEANAPVYSTLKSNVELWQIDSTMAPLHIHNLAVTDRNAQLTLYCSEEFSRNQGTASLEPADASEAARTVTGVKLDEFLGRDVRVGVMKIDVEGHELAVLRGAERLLAEKRVRDIIFEDHGPYPSPAQRLLERRHFTVFQISRSVWRPLLGPANGGEDWSRQPVGVLPNYLATADPFRALERLQAGGWRMLRVD